MIRIREPRTSRCLVIGSGIAGLQYALLAAEHGDVNIVTKKGSTDSNTNYAQGGIAAAMSPLDDFETHLQDTLTAGDGLCDEAVTRDMVEAGPRLIHRLLQYGVEFSREEQGRGESFALGREGGHTHNRILHASDLTGRELEQKLLQACQAHPRIGIEENHIGLDLIMSEELGGVDAPPGRVVGCWVLERTRLSRTPYLADVVVLATGGCGKVYAYTSNPDIATGDGMAMAYRAGAVLANLEFVQFHPTCLYHPEAKSFLMSEAVRGEGARLINSRAERFMERYHQLKELAPRDVVARAIDQEMKLSGASCVYLDLRHLDRGFIKKRFPNLYQACAKFGIDMAGEPVPVVPAAHYMCGGVLTDDRGRSSLPGLFVVGECACTGVHGANRLASNSLLEAVYFAEQASSVLAEEPVIFTDSVTPSIAGNLSSDKDSGPEAMVLEHDWDIVRRVMWDYVGIVRNEQRLRIALTRLRAIRNTVEDVAAYSLWNPSLVELRNIALVAELIVISAQQRQESRGLHYTDDHPAKDPQQSSNTLLGGDTDLHAMVTGVS